jgi:hypothetical protein
LSQGKIEEGKEGAKREQFPEGSGDWEKVCR